MGTKAKERVGSERANADIRALEILNFIKGGQRRKMNVKSTNVIFQKFFFKERKSDVEFR